jgi:hypothetical protein
MRLRVGLGYWMVLGLELRRFFRGLSVCSPFTCSHEVMDRLSEDVVNLLQRIYQDVSRLTRLLLLPCCRYRVPDALMSPS